MLCAVIKGPSSEEAKQQIISVQPYADLVELRLDCFSTFDLDALKNLRSTFSIPMIFTLKGFYTIQVLTQLLDLRPHYIDLETETFSDLQQQVFSQYPEVKLILSHHDFSRTPENEELERIYFEMCQIPAHYYKIAVTAKTCLEALRFVDWAKKYSEKLIFVSMGIDGQLSRILGPVMGNPITYASVEEGLESSPGQFSAKCLVERYHHRSLNRSSAIYGLIGDPVEQSIGDETHNTFIKNAGYDAVYLKMRVKNSELEAFLQFAKKFGLSGLSVTMPLKESFLPYLDSVDSVAQEIGAVNTLIFREEKIFGFNTDSTGALDAIEEVFLVKNLHVIILGAGGAAKAIAHEAMRRGAFITLLNRNTSKALEISDRLGCEGGGFEEMGLLAKRGYDILINCTPVSMPIAVEHILPTALVMDIRIKSKEMAFLKQAEEKGARAMDGYNMFIKQAIGQFNLWFQEPALKN